MTELPKGWVEVPIGDLCQIVGGSTPSTKVDNYWDGEIPWLTPDDLARDRSQYLSRGRRTITKAGYAACSAQMVPAGTVLFTSRAPIGYVAIAREPLCTNQGFKSFVPPDGLSSEYLYWYLRWATPMIRAMGSGTTFAEISGKAAKTILLRLSPRPEQERIVAAIEEQVSRLDEAESSVRRARRRVKQMRSAVLARAVTGDWPRSELSRILTSLKNGIFVSRPSPDPPGVPIFRISAVRPLQLDVDDVRYADLSGDEVQPFLVEAGDLLFTRYSGNPAYVGSCAVVPAAGAATVHPDKLIRAVVDRECTVPQYLAIALNVGDGRRQIEKRLKTTAGQVGIAGGQLKTVQVALPPVDEQERIVKETEAQLTSIKAVEEEIDRALRRSTRLRRSILERAFSGRLVLQDPRDEPASVLLARVAADRATATKAPRRKRA